MAAENIVATIENLWLQMF